MENGMDQPKLSWSFDLGGPVYSVEELFPHETLRPTIVIHRKLKTLEVPFRLLSSLENLQYIHGFEEDISQVQRLLDIKPVQYIRK
jgi:hypothetical protein